VDLTCPPNRHPGGTVFVFAFEGEFSIMVRLKMEESNSYQDLMGQMACFGNDPDSARAQTPEEARAPVYRASAYERHLVRHDRGTELKNRPELACETELARNLAGHV
jgi:hypothetical protein